MTSLWESVFSSVKDGSFDQVLQSKKEQRKEVVSKMQGGFWFGFHYIPFLLQRLLPRVWNGCS